MVRDWYGNCVINIENNRNILINKLKNNLKKSKFGRYGSRPKSNQGRPGIVHSARRGALDDKRRSGFNTLKGALGHAIPWSTRQIFRQ